VAMAQRRQHVHGKGLCSHDPRPNKGRAFARRWRAQCVGADSEPELGVRSSEQRYDTIARQGSARGDDGSGTCKATGSARWPALKRRRVCAAAWCGTAGITQVASSHGSVQPRLEGRVHNKVKGETHLAFLDTTARRRGGAEEEDWGLACCRGSRTTRRRLQQVRLLFHGGDLTTDGSGLGVGVPGSGCSGFAAATHGTPSSGGLACRPDSGMVLGLHGLVGASLNEATSGFKQRRSPRSSGATVQALSPFSSSPRTAEQRLQILGGAPMGEPARCTSPHRLPRARRWGGGLGLPHFLLLLPLLPL
jgi:hypothetical protein